MTRSIVTLALCGFIPALAEEPADRDERELDHRVGLAFDPAGKRLAISSRRGEVTRVLALE